MDDYGIYNVPRFTGDDNERRFDDSHKEIIHNLIKDAHMRKELRQKKRQKKQNDDDNDQKIEEIMKGNDEKCHDNVHQNLEGEENGEVMMDNERERNNEMNDETEDNDKSHDNEETLDLNETIDKEFPIIGNVNKLKLKPLKRVLPQWISNPIVFDIKTDDSFDNFQHLIDNSIITKLKQNGVNSLFPVQKAVIPFLIKSFANLQIIRPRDVCVSSPTGSGKTLAFVIPIVNHLLHRIVTSIRVLVVLPVRDLAVQVHRVFEDYCKNTTIKVGLAIGQKSFSEEQSVLMKKNINGNKYESLVDILIATPGRLVDLMQRSQGFSLRHLQILVLDESDRMMNDIEFNWYEEIEKCVYGDTINGKYHCICHVNDQIERQCIESQCSCIIKNNTISKPIHKLLFSATLSNDPEILQSIPLFHPILYSAASTEMDPSQTYVKKRMIPIELQEFMVICKDDRKPLIIWYLIEVLNYRKVLCFTGSVENTHRLFLLLKKIPNIMVEEFTSKLNAKKREKILHKFSNGIIDVIVCSDIFARGLDIDNINCVICYDPPRNDTAYIHRIGRTARAGKEGTAITLLSPKQLGHFNIIVRRAHHKHSNDKSTDLSVKKLIIKESALKPLQEKYNNALSSLSKHVMNEKKYINIKKRSAIKGVHNSMRWKITNK